MPVFEIYQNSLASALLGSAILGPVRLKDFDTAIRNTQQFLDDISRDSIGR
jgi:hypothetical protein